MPKGRPATFTQDQIDSMREMYLRTTRPLSAPEIARIFKCSPATVHRAVAGTMRPKVDPLPPAPPPVKILRPWNVAVWVGEQSTRPVTSTDFETAEAAEQYATQKRAIIARNGWGHRVIVSEVVRQA